MRLYYKKLDLAIDIIENQVNVISIENPDIYSDIIFNLFEEINGELGDFILSDSAEEIGMDKGVEIIFNPFSLSCNDKKIISKLYKDTEAFSKENLVDRSNEINSNVISYLDAMSKSVEFTVDYNLELDIQVLLKAYAFRIQENYESLLEKIIDYLRISKEVLKTNIFIFVNLKQFLKEEDIEQLYEFVFYQKINLIIIESPKMPTLSNERSWLIDKDNCIINMN